MSIAFKSLCEEIGRLQVRMIRREGNPGSIFTEAIQVLSANHNALMPRQQDMPCVPLFLRSCATLFRNNDYGVASYREVLESTGRIAEAYVCGKHGDVNESATVLQALVALSRNSSRDDALNPVPFSALVTPSFENTMQKWQQHNIQPHTTSLISLLRGADAVYGKGFHFTPASADMTGLLPIKSKVQMEAKVQKCVYSRNILKSLREMQLSKLDAGVCLTCLAETGFYDAELCNICCDVLFSTHALVTSQQFAQIIYSLGVLQHRHVHQKFFSTMINFKQCNAEAVRRHVMGIAMLRQPPHSERALMDGIFLHALRPTDPLEHSTSPGETLMAEWFLDVGHALACLSIHHYKFRLMMARTLRTSIACLSTQERCKMLYAIGGIEINSVPEGLRKSWSGKVVRTIGVLTERLRYDVDPSDGPFVMNALLHCGVRDHPMIPRSPDLNSGENPIEILLRTWATCPKERVLHLTEQIRPRHLGNRPTATLSNVFTVIASNCGASSSIDSYRFGSLCDAVNDHGGQMSVDEALGTIEAIQCIGIGGKYRQSLVTLIDNLWRQKDNMTAEQQTRCCRVLEGLGHLDLAVELLEYMVST